MSSKRPTPSANQQRNRYPATTGSAAPDWLTGEWTIPLDETPFGEIFADHVDQGMDFIALVSDYHARRGTGKSTCSVGLSSWFDRTDEGLIPEKVTQSPEEYIRQYAVQPGGSGLVFDEAESGANARNAMKTINKELNERVAIGRVGEKYSCFNMPDVSQIDKEIRKMAHVWVLVTRVGRARVYRLSNNPFENKVYPTAICEISWPDLPDNDPCMAKLNEQKWEKLDGEEGTKHVPIDEHREKVRKAKEQERREARNEFIINAMQADLLPQKELASIFDVSQSTVSNVWQEAKDNGEAAS